MTVLCAMIVKQYIQTFKLPTMLTVGGRFNATYRVLGLVFNK